MLTIHQTRREFAGAERNQNSLKSENRHLDLDSACPFGLCKAVDVYIPGCPPNPHALLRGVLLAVGRLRPAGRQ
jgi:Ni,Fe-hydrogenase III small subunit